MKQTLVELLEHSKLKLFRNGVSFCLILCILLSILMTNKSHFSGYVPPEYVRKGIYSMKYDVYSFGVLVLQIISGKRNTCYYGPQENLNLLEYVS